MPAADGQMVSATTSGRPRPGAVPLLRNAPARDERWTNPGASASNSDRWGGSGSILPAPILPAPILDVVF